jgi:Major intrinsic protein
MATTRTPMTSFLASLLSVVLLLILSSSSSSCTYVLQSEALSTSSNTVKWNTQCQKIHLHRSSISSSSTHHRQNPPIRSWRLLSSQRFREKCHGGKQIHENVLISVRGGSSSEGGEAAPSNTPNQNVVVASSQKQKSLFQSSEFRRELLAELIGTYLIVMIGCGSVMSAVFTGSLVGLFQIASVWIIAVTVAIYTTAKISGAHLNPAISIAFATIRDFDWKKVVPYIVAQLAGAVLGSASSFAMYGSTINEFESANGIIRNSAVSGIVSAKVFGEYFA